MLLSRAAETGQECKLEQKVINYIVFEEALK